MTKLQIVEYTFEYYTQVLRSFGHTKPRYTDPNEENWLRDINKKNAKAAVFLKQGVHDIIF